MNVIPFYHHVFDLSADWRLVLDVVLILHVDLSYDKKNRTDSTVNRLIFELNCLDLEYLQFNHLLVNLQCLPYNSYFIQYS